MEIGSVKRIHMNEWKNTGVPFFRARDIVAKFNNKKISDPIYISEETYNSNILKSGKVKKGQLLITGVGTIGIPYLITDDSPLYFKDGNVIWLKNNNYDGNFIFYFFTTNLFKNYLFKITGTGTVGTYTIENAKKTPISTPQINEQIKIGKLFNILENLLALYERKTRLLGKLRTFLTQRLFSNSSKVSLYFDNKNWSKHKISEFLTERNEKVVPNSSIPLVSFTVEKGVTPKSKRYNREFLVKDDNKKYKITKKDDIVYNPANLKFGAIARNKFGNAAFSPIYVTFITKLNPAFTEFLVCRKDFINLALKYQEGTVYERMAVKSKDFLNLKIYLPNSSRDINHISQILQSLDTLVSLNKNKVSLITLIKKELLNTMFI